MRFYKLLLRDGEDYSGEGCANSISAKIVYSYLAADAMLNSGEVFDPDGGFFNQNNLPNVEGRFLLIPRRINPTRIADNTNLSRRTIYNSLDELRNAGLIDGDEIYIYDGLFSNGYFDLITETGLKGSALIVYSYLVWRIDKASERFEYPLTEIDTFRYKIAQELNMPLPTVCDAYERCLKEGWIERVAVCHNGFVRWYTKVNKYKGPRGRIIGSHP